MEVDTNTTADDSNDGNKIHTSSPIIPKVPLFETCTKDELNFIDARYREDDDSCLVAFIPKKYPNQTIGLEDKVIISKFLNNTFNEFNTMKEKKAEQIARAEASKINNSNSNNRKSNNKNNKSGGEENNIEGEESFDDELSIRRLPAIYNGIAYLHADNVYTALWVRNFILKENWIKHINKSIICRPLKNVLLPPAFNVTIFNTEDDF
ncbi:CLUMA_CG020406, isoform A [Clunio marinus]|uniref:CLUMA_CG020406, isoform A n=1 Tax=Clunio marinus TaxID=568069 RepID=A0A1J1J6N1_9DIPT|nr:CLUMA_CG020406, isoform A [Clunio marinus]